MLSKKINSLVNNKGVKFFVANALFSASSFAFLFILPYTLKQEQYASTIFSIQIIYLLTMFFEMGLSISFLRNSAYDYQKSNIHSIAIETIIIVLILFLGLWTNNPINYIVSLHSENLRENIFVYFSIAANIIWIFNKNHNIVEQNFLSLLKRSSVIFIGRIILISVLFFDKKEIFHPQLVLTFFFIIPFTLELILFIKRLFHYFYNKLWSKILRKDLFSFIIFSIQNYVAGILFNYTSRIYLLEANHFGMSAFIADAGYAMSFIGIINLLNNTLRTYFIGKPDMSSKEAILLHYNKVSRFGKFFIFSAAITSLLISIVIFYIKPSSLTTNAPIYTFLLIFTNSIVMYLGMFTLLSKTLNLLNFEIKINIIRLTLIFTLTYYLLENHPLYTIIFGQLILIVTEIVMKKYIQHKLLNGF